MKYVLITNVPSPYRAKQYNLIYTDLKKRFLTIYQYSTYPTTMMKWERPNLTHEFIFLDKIKRFLVPSFLNLFLILIRKSPSIIITSGFNLIMLVGFFYSKLFNRKHVVFTDSWMHPVKQLTYLHHIVRKVIIKRSHGFICIGKKGKDYLQYYGAEPKRIYISRLSDTIPEQFSLKKEYDLLFSGQLIERKQPLFFAEVVIKVSKLIDNLKILILGIGPLESLIKQKLNNNGINYTFQGYVKPAFIKEYYASSKILLFPTKNDPWGMVANDAMSVGLPVITTPFAGCADDLVIDGYNGFVLDLDIKTWTEKVNKLLLDEKLYAKFSKNALSKIKEFSVEKASVDFTNALIEIGKS